MSISRIKKVNEPFTEDSREDNQLSIEFTKRKTQQKRLRKATGKDIKAIPELSLSEALQTIKRRSLNRNPPSTECEDFKGGCYVNVIIVDGDFPTTIFNILESQVYMHAQSLPKPRLEPPIPIRNDPSVSCVHNCSNTNV